MVTTRFFEAEGGQAILLVAGGFAMLLAALAFAVDWGYGYTQRRAMTNAAQAAALAGGRLMAQSVTSSGGVFIFTVKQEDVWTTACGFARQNIGRPETAESYTMTLEFLTAGGTTDVYTPITSTFTSASCSAVSGTSAVAITARDIRITTTTTYATLFGGIVGQPTVAAGGSARVRVAGVSDSALFSGGHPWPIVAHYNHDNLTASTSGPGSTPATLWSNGVGFGNGSWKGAVDLARYSGYQSPSGCGGSGCPQLLTSWDQSGSAYATPSTAPKPTISPSIAASSCSGATWDTAGAVPAQQSTDKNCAVPNWTYYGFQGQLSLCTNWSGVSASPIPSACPTGTGAPTAHPSQVPSPLPTNRGVCVGPSAPPTYVSVPSCANGRTGDWVEAFTGAPVQSALLAAVTNLGTTDQYSTTNIPSTSIPYGKKLVVNAYLWDCAETWNNPSGPWQTILNTSGGSGTDCSDTDHWPNGASAKVGRVHLFAVAPFTFYEGLFTQDPNSIRGFWGGAFISPDACPAGACDISTINTAVLVGE